MCALVGAVLGAGSDTAVDLHRLFDQNIASTPRSIKSSKR